METLISTDSGQEKELNAIWRAFHIATIGQVLINGTAATSIRYIATDTLSGSNIVTNASGTVAEALDYFPYGGLRIDSKTNYGGLRNRYGGTTVPPK